MGILGFDTMPFVISIASALIVGGAIFIYMRARISDLERSHVEQARVLRTFIAQQQQQHHQQQLQHMVGRAPTVGPVDASVVAPSERPKERIVVSEDGSDCESDIGSEYETDSVSNDSMSDVSEASSAQLTADLETRVIELSGTLQSEAIGSSAPAVVVDDAPDYHKMKVDPLRVLALKKGLIENMEQGKKMRKPAIISLLVGDVDVDKTVDDDKVEGEGDDVEAGGDDAVETVDVDADDDDVDASGDNANDDDGN